MKDIKPDFLKKCANNLMFDITDEECEALIQDFEDVFRQMNDIKNIEGINDVDIMVFPFEVTTDFLREDVEIEPLPVEDVLKNAKDVAEGQIKLPKVVG